MLALDLLRHLPDAPRDREERLTTDGVTWAAYETLLARAGDRAGYRLAYLDGLLEIASPSCRHEGVKKRLATLLEVYFEETETEYVALGSTTFRDRQRGSGIEPDESYCVGVEGGGVEGIGVERDVPDLEIEVVVTGGGTDKLEIYRCLGVQEVWFWQAGAITAFQLDGDRYRAGDRSELCPDLDFAVLASCVAEPSTLQAIRAFRRWCQMSRDRPPEP